MNIRSKSKYYRLQPIFILLEGKQRFFFILACVMILYAACVFLIAYLLQQFLFNITHFSAERIARIQTLSFMLFALVLISHAFYLWFIRFKTTYFHNNIARLRVLYANAVFGQLLQILPPPSSTHFIERLKNFF